jgi:NAD(P)-dependent dehydrogenase (short-subunit alcohol dehydrogenase family)
MAMDSFTGKLAVVTGAGSGMGRGQDAAWLDRLVRARPEVAYDYQGLVNEAAVAEYTSTAQAAGQPTT